jgi:hypothetical protein
LQSLVQRKNARQKKKMTYNRQSAGGAREDSETCKHVSEACSPVDRSSWSTWSPCCCRTRPAHSLGTEYQLEHPTKTVWTPHLYPADSWSSASLAAHPARDLPEWFFACQWFQPRTPRHPLQRMFPHRSVDSCSCCSVSLSVIFRA